MADSDKWKQITLTDMEGENCHVPCIASEDGAAVFLCCQSADMTKDQILGGWIQEEQIQWNWISEGPGLAFRPCVAVEGEEVWVFWTEFINGGWAVKCRGSKSGSWQQVLTVCSTQGAFHISAKMKNGTIWVSWSEHVEDKSYIMSARLSDGNVDEIIRVSEESQAYRPAVAVDYAGNWFIAYDFFNGSNYEIAISTFLDNRWSESMVITTEHNWASSVSLASCESGVSACWQDFKEQANIGYWQSDVERGEDGVLRYQTRQICHHVSWSTYSEIASNTLGWQVMVYSWNGKLLHMRYRKPGGSWSESVELFESDTSYCIRPEVLLNEDCQVRLVYQHSNGNGQHERKSGISYVSFPLDSLFGREDNGCETGINRFLEPIAAQKTLCRLTEETVSLWLKEHGHYGECIGFGDIHGHSNLSDGLGEPDQYFHRAKVAGLQLSALTDHDVFPDILTPSEWELQKAEANRFNQPDFITMIAYEWTPNELRYNYGHKNIYYREEDGGFYPCSDPSALTPDRLFKTLHKEYGGKVLVIPHHPSAVWRIANAATDWDFHDSELQRLVEIVSRHASFEYSGSSLNYTKNNKQLPLKSVQDALMRRYRLGIISGSDSHQMEHGIEGGVLAAYMTRKTRSGLFDALYERRVYATTGAGILLDFRIDNTGMGQELICAEGSGVRIYVSVMGTGVLGKVEVIKNQEIIFCSEPMQQTFEAEIEAAVTEDFAWYYLRVTQSDCHMAWSSPIWISVEEENSI